MSKRIADRSGRPTVARARRSRPATGSVTRLRMSGRTLALLAAVALLGASFYFFPPAPWGHWYAERDRFILLFMAVGLWGVSWVLDEWTSRY